MTKRSEARFQLVLSTLMTIVFAITLWRAYEGEEGRKVMAVLYGIVVVFLWVRYVQARRRERAGEAAEQGQAR